MMKLLIEGLRENYALLEKAILATENRDVNKDYCFNALADLCRGQLAHTTYYAALPPASFLKAIDEDMRYVDGSMTDAQMEVHRAWHWRQIEQYETLNG